MIEVIPRESMGRTKMAWLDARHHFSFGDYQDPERVSFGPLRVWNDDLFRPGGGFPMHPHRDMEIVTLVHKGAIAHADSLGNGGTVEAGDVQVMSAGTGIVHSEYNKGTEDLELFQVWLHPDREGHEPRWETRRFDPPAREGRFVAVASGREGHEDVLAIYQDAAFHLARLSPGQAAAFRLGGDRRAYLVAVDGPVTVNGVTAPPRAGVQIKGEEDLTVVAGPTATEVVLLDLP